MNRTLPILLAALLTLAACGDDGAGDAEAPAESSTADEAGEAGEALEDAARETGEAARSAAEDIGEAIGPALDRAEDVGQELLEGAQEGLNDATRAAACQTARAAEDQEGIEANC